MNKMAIMIAVAAMSIFSIEAFAADIKIEQKAKKFSEKKLKAAVGDSIVFVNTDEFTHNLYSKKGVKFDSGVLKPGDIFKLGLDAAGKFTVRCAIHPKMKLKVTTK